MLTCGDDDAVDVEEGFDVNVGSTTSNDNPDWWLLAASAWKFEINWFGGWIGSFFNLLLVLLYLSCSDADNAEATDVSSNQNA